MKKLVLILLFSIFNLYVVYCQETINPSFGVKLERNVDFAIIEDQTYSNVTIELDAADINDLFKEGVKIIVRNRENSKKIIYKKRFSKSYLYGFSDGSISVGKGNILTQVLLFKSNDTGDWVMAIREKGLY